MDKNAALANIPASVIERVRHALSQIARLEAEKAGYKRLGMSDRYDDDLDAAMAPYRATIETFRRCAAAKGIDANAAIATM